MPSKYVTDGSISDMLNLIKNDVLDTYNNQCAVLQNLIDSESTNQAVSCRFALNDNQYRIENGGGSGVYNIHSCDNADTIISSIDINDDDNTWGLWTSLDELEQAISECADSSFFMYQVANVAESDGDDQASMIEKINATTGHWALGSTYTSEAYNDVINTVSAGGDSRPALIQWLVNQYQNLASMVGNDDDGSIQFADDNYRVQGFAGSYAVGVVFQAVSSVIGLVATAVAPIIGVAITVVGTIARSLLGLIPDKSDTRVVEKNSSNNAYAQPVFQGSIPWSYVEHDISRKIYSLIYEGGACTVRTPGLVTVLNKYFDKQRNMSMLQFESYLSLDWLNCKNTTFYNYSFASASSNRWNCLTPFVEYMNTYATPASFKTHTLSANDAADWLRTMALSTTPTGYASFYNQVEAVLQTGEDMPDQDDVMTNFDRAVRWAMFMTLLCYTGGMSYFAEGGTVSYDWSQSVGSFPTSPGASLTVAHEYLLHVFNDVGSGSFGWEFICNKCIPAIRRMTSTTTPFILFLSHIVDRTYMGQPNEYVYITGQIINLKKPHYEPPKYSEGARAATIAIIAATAAVTIAAVVGKQALKISQRKKQLARYQRVQQLGDQFKANPDDPNIAKQYRKAIKKYNRWSKFTGTSRLSKVSGWETGDSGSTVSSPVNLQGIYDQGKAILTQGNSDYESTNDISLDAISRLIRG